MHAGQRIWRPLSAAALYTLLRLPSFFEPHWYTDEAGYTTTAQALLRGKLLYAGIWNNKPPLHLWTIAAAVRLLGPAEWGLHLLTYLSGLAVLGAVLWAGSRLLRPRAAFVASLLVAAGLGLPILDAELAIPESLLIAPVSWAALLAIVEIRDRRAGAPPRPWLAPAAGLLAAAGIAYQQTAVADAAAIGLILALGPFARREVLAYVGAVVLPTAAWIGIFAVLAGPATLAFALAGFYVPYSHNVIPQHPPGLALYAGTLAVAVGLAVGAAALLRGRGQGWAIWTWAIAALLVPAAARQPFPHFLLPSLVPAVLAVCSLPLWSASPRLWLRGLAAAAASGREAWGAAGFAAAAVMAVVMAHGAGLDWIPALASSDYNGYRTLAMYYGGPAVSLARTGSLDGWQDGFDERVPADRQVVAWLRQNHFQGTRAVVWSSDAWIYAAAELEVTLPTGPIYNNFVLLGMDGQVTERVRAEAPDVIVAADQEVREFPEIRALLASDYDPVYSAGPDTVWVRHGFTTPP